MVYVILGIIYSALASLCFAVAPIIYSRYAKFVRPIVLNLIRYAPVVLISHIAVLYGGMDYLRHSDLRLIVMLMIVVVMIGTVIGDTLYLLTIKLCGASIAQAITSLYPLFVFFLSRALLGECVGILQLASVVCVVLGLILVFAGFSENTKTGVRGLLVGIVCAFAWSLSIITSTYILKYISAAEYVAMRSLMSVMILAPIVLSTQIPELRTTSYCMHRVLILMGGGVLELYLGIYLAAEGLRIVGPTVNSTITALSPLLTTIIAQGLKFENLKKVQDFGLVLIVIGVILISISYS